MCGPIVVSLSMNLEGRSATIPQLLYNLGRITTYVILGGMMGLTGSFTMVASQIAGFQRGVLIAGRGDHRSFGSGPRSMDSPERGFPGSHRTEGNRHERVPQTDQGQIRFLLSSLGSASGTLALWSCLYGAPRLCKSRHGSRVVPSRLSHRCRDHVLLWIGNPTLSSARGKAGRSALVEAA